MSEAKAGGPGAKARPLSPHVQIWRWHLTMATSILHRATGVLLYIGAAIAAGWALSLASGTKAYGCYKSLLGSPLGKLALLGLTLAAFYHLANGVRHLVWDSGKGFEPRAASASGAAVIGFAIVATVAVWGLAFTTGVL